MNLILKKFPPHIKKSSLDNSEPCDICEMVRMGRSGEDSRHCKSTRINSNYHHKCVINEKERRVWVRS